MFCIKNQEHDRGEEASKQSFLALTRMGFKTGESLIILGLRKAKIIHWLNSDADFCDSIKSIPNLGSYKEE